MASNPVEIEVLYFEACPSWKLAVGLLETALGEMGIEYQFVLTRVETQEEVDLHRFIGSPTIRVQGDDLFPTGQDTYSLGCRVYPTPEGLRGWPTEAMLKEQLLRRLTGV